MKSKDQLREWLESLASEADAQTRLYDSSIVKLYVNDTFEWKNPRAKGQGYFLGDGQKEVSVDIDTSKKSPILK